MATKEKNYLQIIKFDKNFKNSIVGKYLTNIRLVILVLIIILIAGSASLLALPRRLNPEVKIPIVIVNTLLPGASPADVESLITIPLEDELNSIPNLTSITSNSSNSNSTITLEFESNVEVDDAVNEAQKAVNNANDLPEDATTPRVTEIDFEDQTVYTFAVRSKNDPISLMNFSKNLQDSLESQNTIERVDAAGLYEQEVSVQILPDAIYQYNISLPQLSQIIKTALSSFPAGTLKTNDNTYAVTIDPEVTNVAELRNLLINIRDIEIKLGDIAAVIESPIPEQKKAFLAENTSPDQVVILSVFKTSNADITKTVNDAKNIIEENTRRENGKYEVTEITDYAKLITNQFNDLSENFAVTILLVFIVLFLVLGFRQAFLASLTIPLAILTSFFVMQISGISINFLSLFSLLLALGLLVDNAIVILSAVTSYYKSNRFSAEESGILVYKDFLAPLWATTLTTVWAFLPLLLATGIIGEFIKTIPVVVSATLIASALIALYITIPIMMFVLKPNVPRRVIILFYLIGAAFFLILGFLIIPQSIIYIPTLILYILFLLVAFKMRKFIFGRIKIKKEQKKLLNKFKSVADSGLINFDIISSKYNKVLSKIVHSKSARRKTIIAVILFSLFSYMLLPLGLLKNEFFPAAPSDELYVTVDFPSGTNQKILEAETKKLSSVIQEHPDIKYVSGQYGGGQNEFNISGDINLTITLIDEDKRAKNSIEIASEIRDGFKNYPNGEFTVIEQSGGPPVGDDIVITILGPELETLNSITNQISSFMNNQAGITNVKSTITPGIGKLTFIPNRQSISNNSIQLDSIAFSIRNYISGIQADEIRVNGENLPIQLRIDDNSSPDSLGLISIDSPNGFIPLNELGEFRLENSPTQISREDQKRSISIFGSVLSGYNIPEENQKILDHIESLNLPDGYSLKTGGVNEENQNSINSILQAMGASAILILITIVIQLGSFRKAIIVMLVIPLAVSGVFIIFALFGIPISFPALIGLLALFGIVVNNSIVMIDTINKNLNNKISFGKSIVDGASSRLEPIFLTSITTIIGLIPITLSDPLWQGLGGAIIAGLTFSGVIMLFFIPVVYYLIYSGEYEKKNTKKSS